ncbi:MAG: metallophosphoesterase [Treponema sp.]|nr:metallophosphoesterase [Treponema sp.]
MKILALPDSHGSPLPYQTAIKNLELVDKVVFLGDYFDHGTIGGFTFENQRENFLNILELKKSYPEKVVVLVGNHDFCYLIERMAREQQIHQEEIKQLIDENAAFLDFAFLEGEWLFSHAGFAANWMINQGMQEINLPLINSLNDKVHQKKYESLGIRGSELVGFDPLEIRSEQLKELAVYMDINQVVGHTELYEEERLFIMKNNRKLVFLDSPKRNVAATIDTMSGEVGIIIL